MHITDPIADMLTRIRNANSARHDTVDVPASNMKKSIAQILLDEGYIKSYQIVDDGTQGVIHITLKYNGKDKVITGLRRVSKPGLRVYVGADELPRVLRGLGMNPIMWFSNAWTARAVIIIALIWRWTGYNMVFYLSGMQNIEYSIYEAAKIDGASPLQTFFKITVPLLKPMILLTTITSTNGTLQLFDESLNLTNGGPGKSTMTMSHYIYNMSFVQSPNFGYAAAMSILILIMVAILALLQMKVGDER